MIIQFLNGLNRQCKTGHFLILCRTQDFRPAFTIRVHPTSARRDADRVFQRYRYLERHLVFSHAFQSQRMGRKVQLIVSVIDHPSQFPMRRFSLSSRVAVPKGDRALFLRSQRHCHRFAQFRRLAKGTMVNVTLRVVIFTFRVGQVAILFASRQVRIIIGVGLKPTRRFFASILREDERLRPSSRARGFSHQSSKLSRHGNFKSALVKLRRVYFFASYKDGSSHSYLFPKEYDMYLGCNGSSRT